MRKKRLVVVTILLLLVQVAYAVELPEPQGYFSDFTNIISTSESERLESSLRQLNSQHGIEFAIVTIEHTGDLTAKEYAVTLFEQWGIGSAKEDNGLLLLNVIGGETGGRDILFEVGYGLEGVFTDVRTGIILDESLDYFRNDELVAGYQSIIEQVRQVISGQAEPLQPSQEQQREEYSERSIPRIATTIVTIYLFLLVGSRLTRQWWLYNILYQLLFIFFRGGRGGGGFGGGGFGGFGGGRSGGGGSGRRY